MLNNVPPNVSLQRSSNAAPDTQLSPGFSPTLMQQQLSPNQRAAFSPQSNQGNSLFDFCRLSQNWKSLIYII